MNYTQEEQTKMAKKKSRIEQILDELRQQPPVEVTPERRQRSEELLDIIRARADSQPVTNKINIKTVDSRYSIKIK